MWVLIFFVWCLRVRILFLLVITVILWICPELAPLLGVIYAYWFLYSWSSTEEVATAVLDFLCDFEQAQDLISHLPQIVIHIYDLIDNSRAFSALFELILKLAHFWELVLLKVTGLGPNRDFVFWADGIASLFQQLRVSEVNELLFLGNHSCCEQQKDYRDCMLHDSLLFFFTILKIIKYVRDDLTQIKVYPNAMLDTEFP